MRQQVSRPGVNSWDKPPVWRPARGLHFPHRSVRRTPGRPSRFYRRFNSAPTASRVWSSAAIRSTAIRTSTACSVSTRRHGTRPVLPPSEGAM